MTREPVAIATTLATIINLIVLLVFKADLALEVQAAIVTIVTAIAGFFARSRVTPVVKVVKPA